jgi:hypothetical protein
MLDASVPPQMTVTLPPWLSLIGVKQEILLVATSRDGSGDQTTKVVFAPLERASLTTSSNILTLQPVITQDVRNQVNSFLAAADPNQDINGQSSLSWEDYKLDNAGAAVYQPFPVSVSLFANGDLAAQYAFTTSLPDAFASYLSAVIDQIPDSAYKNNPQQRREALHNKLDAAIKAFRAGNAKGAYQMLQQDIMAHFDGDNGGNPDDDWISDPFIRQNTYGPFKKVADLLLFIAGA